MQTDQNDSSNTHVSVWRIRHCAICKVFARHHTRHQVGTAGRACMNRQHLMLLRTPCLVLQPLGQPHCKTDGEGTLEE